MVLPRRDSSLEIKLKVSVLYVCLWTDMFEVDEWIDSYCNTCGRQFRDIYFARVYNNEKYLLPDSVHRVLKECRSSQSKLTKFHSVKRQDSTASFHGSPITSTLPHNMMKLLRLSPTSASRAAGRYVHGWERVCSYLAYRMSKQRNKLQTMVSPKNKATRQVSNKHLPGSVVWNNKYIQELDTQRQRPLMNKV